MGTLGTLYGVIEDLNGNTGDIVWGHWVPQWGHWGHPTGTLGTLNGAIEVILWGHWGPQWGRWGPQWGHCGHPMGSLGTRMGAAFPACDWLLALQPRLQSAAPPCAPSVSLQDALLGLGAAIDAAQLRDALRAALLALLPRAVRGAGCATVGVHGAVVARGRACTSTALHAWLSACAGGVRANGRAIVRVCPRVLTACRCVQA